MTTEHKPTEDIIYGLFGHFCVNISNFVLNQSRTILHYERQKYLLLKFDDICSFVSIIIKSFFMSCIFEPLVMKPSPGCAKQDPFANLERNSGK